VEQDLGFLIKQRSDIFCRKLKRIYAFNDPLQTYPHQPNQQTTGALRVLGGAGIGKI
jgi:hypothetical protein